MPQGIGGGHRLGAGRWGIGGGGLGSGGMIFAGGAFRTRRYGSFTAQTRTPSAWWGSSNEIA
jgi:hypothetical protein